MRNHSKVDKDKDKTKYAKVDIVRTKSTRKAHESNQPTLVRKPKEKSSDPMVADCSSDATATISSECIYLDVGSKKSYIDLSEAKSSNEPYSRISVIRSVKSQALPSPKSNEFEFYQEKPVDFSPKHKYKSDCMNGNNKNNNALNEISVQYTTMVV